SAWLYAGGRGRLLFFRRALAPSGELRKSFQPKVLRERRQQHEHFAWVSSRRTSRSDGHLLRTRRRSSADYADYADSEPNLKIKLPCSSPTVSEGVAPAFP